jgi:hypothetical protein
MDYDNYKLFRWNENNILYKNDTNIYNNVYLHTGTVIKGQWENCVCFTHINNNVNIISNSNHFIHGYKWWYSYNNMYKIYDNIVKNYKEFREYDKNNEYDFDEKETYFYMLNAFCFSNSGHDLSTGIDYINYILSHNIKNILIYKNYKNTNNFKLLSLLIPDDFKVIELDENKIYKIKNIIIIYPELYDIFKHPTLIDDLIKKVKKNYAEKYKDLHNKKIVLMKTNRNKNVMLDSNQLHCEDMLLELEKNDYIVLIPEETNIFKLCIYLLFASKVIFSTGSVIYTNKIFINKNAKLLFFGHNGKLTADASGISNNVKILEYTNNRFSSEECLHFTKQILEY